MMLRMIVIVVTLLTAVSPLYAADITTRDVNSALMKNLTHPYLYFTANYTKPQKI
jgi:hypothetical protein